MIEDEPLARFIRLRWYSELDKVVGQLIHMYGWPRVASQLESIPTPTAHDYSTLYQLATYPRPDYFLGKPVVRPYYITEPILRRQPALFSREDIGWGVREGTTRDGIVHILGLGMVPGIDLESLEPFEGIEASSLDELRQSVIPVALEVLKSQAAEHRTFFLDVDAMSTSQFAPAVPDIIEARKREIDGLEEESLAHEIARTYYGFKVLTEGSIQDTSTLGFTDSSLETLDEIVKTLGRDTKLSRSWRRSSWWHAWKDYDDLTQALLQAIMLVSIGGRKKGIPDGLRVIGDLGDSRALPTLHRLLNLIPVRSDRLHNVLEAIGLIGHPTSFDRILPLAKKKTVGGRKALAEMALIRSPKSTEHLLKVLEKNTGDQRALVAERLWMTFDSRAEDALQELWNRVARERIATEGPTKVEDMATIGLIKKTMVSLALMGERSRAVLRGYPRVLAKVVEREYFGEGKQDLVLLLRCIKGLAQDRAFMTTIREIDPRYDYARLMTDDWGKM